MAQRDIAELISRGRTDLVFELLRTPGGRSQLPGLLIWFVYYNDLTALRAVLEAGLDLAGLDLGRELGNAAFSGHWKIADFLIAQGASVNWIDPDTGETPLHGAVSKAGRPHYAHVVKLLLDHGADPNAQTIPGKDTGAFMRDVRTRGEAPLHRAAAFGDETIIGLLLDKGGNWQLRDANDDTPLAWASWHLRPGAILALLAYGPHTITQRHIAAYTGDHGQGWGGMEAHTLGDYLPLGR